MNKKKITALLLSSVMALTPAMPAMAEQSTIVNYVDGTTDSTVETPDVTPTPLPEKKEGTAEGIDQLRSRMGGERFFAGKRRRQLPGVCICGLT